MVKRIANATIGADNICASIKTPIHAILLIDQRFPSEQANGLRERRTNVYLARALNGPYRDLLELTARGAPLSDALNAVVRAVAQVRRTETRAAIFIFGPEKMNLRFAAAEGLDCRRRPNFEHPCRLNIDQGRKAVS